MATESGRLTGVSGGQAGGMPPELLAALAESMAVGPGGQQAAAVIVPLWKVRPRSQKINAGQFGGDTSLPGGGRRTSGRITYGGPTQEQLSTTADYAAGAFLDMSEADRQEFANKAILAGVLNPGSNSPDQVASAWQNAVSYAAKYNAERPEGSYISPWEALDKLGVLNAAGKGGAYDPFRPRKQTQTTARNFTTGQDAQAVSSALESLFSQEMGRAPTQQERLTYQKLVQKAYDMNPETSTSVTTTDPNGDSTTNTTQSGGVDMTATLLDQVRSDPESQAFQAGSTFFQAAMNALGAIA